MIGIDISPIQVKQKEKVGRPAIDAFEAIVMREDCEKGFFALTVKDILDQQIGKRLA